MANLPRSPLQSSQLSLPFRSNRLDNQVSRLPLRLTRMEMATMHSHPLIQRYLPRINRQTRPGFIRLSMTRPRHPPMPRVTRTSKCHRRAFSISRPNLTGPTRPSRPPRCPLTQMLKCLQSPQGTRRSSVLLMLPPAPCPSYPHRRCHFLPLQTCLNHSLPDSQLPS